MAVLFCGTGNSCQARPKDFGTEAFAKAAQFTCSLCLQVSHTALEVERNLDLLGVTAIEDKLQARHLALCTAALFAQSILTIRSAHQDQ